MNVAISPVESLCIDNSLFPGNTNNATTSDASLPLDRWIRRSEILTDQLLPVVPPFSVFATEIRVRFPRREIRTWRRWVLGVILLQALSRFIKSQARDVRLRCFDITRWGLYWFEGFRWLLFGFCSDCQSI